MHRTNMPVRTTSQIETRRPFDASLKALADPAFSEARTLVARGELNAASNCLDQMLEAQPESPVVQYLRADIDLQREDFKNAEIRIRNTLKYAPGYLAALHGLGYLLYRQGRLAEAETEAERLLSLDPSNFPGRLLRAAIAMGAGDQEVAALIYHGILAERPDHVPSILALGHSLRILGESEEAIVTYRRALEHNPACSEAWNCLASLKTYKFSPNDVVAMEGLARRAGMPPLDRLFIHFALGKAYFDQKDDPRAFAHYAEAKTLALGQAPRDRMAEDGWSSWIAQSISVPHDAVDSASASDVPIFIVGMPRAGSTLVEQIIGSHSRVEATAELPYLDLIARRVAESCGGIGGVDRRALADEYLSATRLHRKTDKPWFIDKLPVNWRHVGLIKTILPQARIIDVRRYPMASCVAVFRQHFLGVGELAGSLADIARTWRKYAQSMRQFEAAWPGAVYRLRYEDLVTDTEAQVRALFTALNLPFEEACLRWFENGQPVRTTSSEQVRQPIFKRGLDEWRRFEPWLAEVRSILADEIAIWDEDT